LMEQQPASPYRVKALQQLGNIALDREEFSEALRYYASISGQSRSPLEEAEVTVGMMVSHFFVKDYPQAITAATQLLAQDELVPVSVAKALSVKGKSHRFLGQNSDAEDSFGLLIQEYTTEEAAEALYLLALQYQEKGDFKGSNELIFDYSTPFSEFDYWYGTMFLLLADNYLKLGEVFQAKATLQSVIDQSTDATVKEKAVATLKSLD
jgi:tetratricopeptide (TPR) repeat protein